MDTTGENSASTAPLRIDELLVAEAFAHPVAQLEVRETAISWIVLTGSFAYKIKKPVRLDFIDASTVELRLHYCREELRLNRRLAPELYIDVVPIARVGGHVRVGSDIVPIIDYAVCMKQFPRTEDHSSIEGIGCCFAVLLPAQEPRCSSFRATQIQQLCRPASTSAQGSGTIPPMPTATSCKRNCEISSRSPRMNSSMRSPSTHATNAPRRCGGARPHLSLD